jgi:hypothetical protein
MPRDTAKRPVRPSVARADASKAAEKFENGPPSRLVIEVSRAVREEVRIRAAERRLTQRAYLLTLLANDGVAAALEDLKRE